MTEYQIALEKLFARRKGFRGRSSMENVQKLAKLLSHPERSYFVVHIAGSNGKGSVATKIAQTLQLAGYRTGLYTSPHISSFRERIIVQDVPISEQDVVEGFSVLVSQCARLEIDPTFFELATMLGFTYFQKQKVDIAVIETGLGGRLDATNIVQPILSILTSISMEHTDLLGNTLEEIAQEKAGIFKQGIPVILGPHADLSVIRQKAAELGCPVYTSLNTSGFYDEENQAIAKTALDALTKKFPKISAYIEEGIQARPSCRFEKHGNVILDVAHNPDALKRLFQAFSASYPDCEARAIIGLSDDKDKISCLRCVASYAKHIYLVEADSTRATPLKEMAGILESLPFTAYSLEQSVTSALQKAQAHKELIVVCGSFYLMGEAKECLGVAQLTDTLGKKPSLSLSS